MANYNIFLFTNLTNINDHHQVKDCPLSETSDGGEDEDKCVKHLLLESMIVSRIYEDPTKMWRSTKSILTLYCGIQLKSFQYTTFEIVIFCEKNKQMYEVVRL